MASAQTSTGRKWTGLTCRQVLNIMVIIGFMFNYMLRVNIAIAILDMIETNHTTLTNSSFVNATDSSMTIIIPDLPSTNSSDPQNVTEPSSPSTKFPWTSDMKNTILGSFFWGYVLTELPGGRMAEIVGARKIFGGGMLAASILTILTPAACYLNYYLVVISRVLVGFFLGATWPAIQPMAAKWIPPLERSNFIANMMASSLGAAITLPFCGLLIAHFGWDSVFYVTGGIGLIWSILWFVLVFDSPADHPRISDEEREYLEAKIAEGDSKKQVKPSKVPWVKILTSLPVWAIIITHGCSVFGYFVVVNQLPTYMKDVLHFNIKTNGLLSSLPYVGKYLMAVISSYVADRLRQAQTLSTTATRKWFTAFAVFIPGCFMIIQAIWGEIPQLSVAVFTSALFFNGAVTAGYLSNALDIAPNFSGTIFGLANTLSSFGGWLSTKLVAILTGKESTFATWRYVFWILVFTYIGGAIFYLIFGTGKRMAWNSVELEEADAKEMQPLKKKQENGTEKELIA